MDRLDRPGLTTNLSLAESGNAEPPKKTRIRKSRSRGLRTKTGCLTCRKRHKKCDERSPVCGPCSISSRDCVYANGAEHVPTTRPKTVAAVEYVRNETNVTARLPLGISASVGSHVSGSPVAASPQNLYPSPGGISSQPSQPPVTIPLADSYQYSYSPDTVSSELLTADLASTRWLDLLATDAAQADSGFSLAPSPAPEESISNSGYSETQPAGTQLGRVGPCPVSFAAAATVERHAWQLGHDMILQNHEAVLFRTFAERAASWLDLFDPHKHFSTYATRLAYNCCLSGIYPTGVCLGEVVSILFRALPWDKDRLKVLRNLGLMKAILALTARHNAIVQANIGASIGNDTSEAVQYYYETLHYVQNGLQYTTYAHSEELLATALVISTYEMLHASDSNWKRHLKGVFWIQRSQNVHGASGGLRQAVWWAWLRQDIWAAFREKRRCFSFWRPVKDYPALDQDEIADRAVYLLSQTVNYCAPVTEPENNAVQRAEAGEALMTMLERWKTFLGPKFKPLPTPENTTSVFQSLWIHPPQFGVALQVYSFAKILITLHRPAAAGFDGYLKTQRILSDAVATICGIAMELKDEGCQITSAQCLFGAGLCVQDDVKRNTIISLIDACEARTGWPMSTLRSDLKAEWAKVG